MDKVFVASSSVNVIEDVLMSLNVGPVQPELRVVFRWLPEHDHSTDMEHGMHYMLWASALAMLLPLFPILYGTNGSTDSGSNDRARLTMYWLLVVAGFFFTLGSYGVKRAVKSPPVKPLFGKYYHTRSDELFGMWCFTLGTSTAIPVMAIYYSLVPEVLYLLGLLAAIVAFLGCVFFTFLVYPKEHNEEHNLISPYFQHFCMNYLGFDSPKKSGSLLFHVRTDLLLASWLFYIGCCVCFVAAFVLFVVGFIKEEGHLMFDASSACLDMFLYAFGGAYFVAGAYPQTDDNRVGGDDSPTLTSGEQASVDVDGDVGDRDGVREKGYSNIIAC